ncbi:13731_t:CDS:2 [Funneliformis mosseae]|uniref:13731_t:CDS:1 n=1 Tax=Funneliformis mosseae TaxID=27381 RepID=A0A9N9F5E5_FUNMO|nr:13731_t:CDS:2 [Funneliformis mosseae]
MNVHSFKETASVGNPSSTNPLATENPNASKIPTNRLPSLLAAQHINIIIDFSHLLIEVAFQVILVEGYHFCQDYSFLEFVVI